MVPPKRSKPAEAPQEKLPNVLRQMEGWSKNLGVHQDFATVLDKATREKWKVNEHQGFEEIYNRMRRPYAEARKDLEKISKISERGVRSVEGLSANELEEMVDLQRALLNQILKITYEKDDGGEEASVLSAYAKAYKFFKEIEGVVLGIREKADQMTRNAARKNRKKRLGEEGVEIARRASQDFEFFIDDTDLVLELLEGGQLLQELDKGNKLMLLRHLIEGPNPFKICGEDEMERVRKFAFRFCEKLKQEKGPFCKILRPYLDDFVKSMK